MALSSAPTFSIGLVGVLGAPSLGTLRVPACFRHPVFGELAGFGFQPDFLHFGAGFRGDETAGLLCSRRIRCVGDGVAHVAQAAFIDEVDD